FQKEFDQLIASMHRDLDARAKDLFQLFVSELNHSRNLDKHVNQPTLGSGTIHLVTAIAQQNKGSPPTKRSRRDSHSDATSEHINNLVEPPRCTNETEVKEE